MDIYFGAGDENIVTNWKKEQGNINIGGQVMWMLVSTDFQLMNSKNWKKFSTKFSINAFILILLYSYTKQKAPEILRTLKDRTLYCVFPYSEAAKSAFPFF